MNSDSAMVCNYLSLSNSLSCLAFKAEYKNVGITEFVTENLPAISSQIKTYPKDFIVQEIDNLGTVCEIKSVNLPIEENEYRINTFKKHNKFNSPCIKSGMSALENLFGKKFDVNFKNFLLKKSYTKENYFELKGKYEKEWRTEFHNIIKNYFPKLTSETFKTENEILIKVFLKKYSKYKKNPESDFLRKKERNFLHFVMYKENYSTTEILNLFNRKMHRKNNIFNFCGNKDKLSISTQNISVYKSTAYQIKSLTKFFPNITLGNYKYSSKKLKLGELSGNRFTITLRKIQRKDTNNLLCSIEKIKEIGFINYFGLQRFGTLAIPTHFLGKLIIQKKYDEFVSLILFPQKNKLNEFRKKLILTKSFEISEKCCPKQFTIEKQILQTLSKFKNSKICFQKLSKNIRSIYIHAYQSYIWNLVASERIKLHGFKLVIGDFVKTKKGDIILVTEVNIFSLNLNIFDVVLPLPFHNMQKPKFSEIDFYDVFMNNDNIKLSMFKNLNKSVIISSQFRYLMAKPNFLQCDIYDNLSIVENEIDKIISKIRYTESRKNEQKIIKQEFKENIAIIKFELKSSSYATMLLRELTKI